MKENYHDIRSMLDEKTKIPKVKIVSAGFPCQPFSFSGKRRGKADNRYLWPETLAVIRKVKPTWCILENVPGIINLALDQVLSDLEDTGYAWKAFIIPAISLDALHRRDRVWIIAYAIDSRFLQNEIEKKYFTKVPGSRPSKDTYISIDIDQFLKARYHTPNRAIDGLSNWMDRYKGLGNAIVPQIAYLFFEIIKEIEKKK